MRPPRPEARRAGGRRLDLEGTGALARIHGQGNAERWGGLHAERWGRLHADLGDVCEILAPVSRRPGLRAVPP